MNLGTFLRPPQQTRDLSSAQRDLGVDNNVGPQSRITRTTTTIQREDSILACSYYRRISRLASHLSIPHTQKVLPFRVHSLLAS